MEDTKEDPYSGSSGAIPFLPPPDVDTHRVFINEDGSTQTVDLKYDDGGDGPPRKRRKKKGIDTITEYEHLLPPEIQKKRADEAKRQEPVKRTTAQLLKEFDERVERERKEYERLNAPDSNVDEQVQTEPVNPHLSLARRIQRHVKRVHQEEQNRYKLLPLSELQDAKHQTSVTLGELRFKRLCETVYEVAACNKDQRGNTISLDPLQVDMIDKYLITVAQIVYGKDWGKSEVQFLKDHNLYKVNTKAILMAPRQFGKTWALKFFIAALVWCVPGISVGIFSIKKDGAVDIVSGVRGLLTNMPNFNKRVSNHSKETLHIISEEFSNLPLNHRTEHPALTKLCAESSTSGRGKGYDVVVVDEIAYVKRSHFTHDIAPIVGNQGRAFIGMSTPAGDQNYYSQMFDMKDDDGDPMFATLPIGLACKPCRDAGMSAECTHKLHILPKWKSGEGRSMLKALQTEAEFRSEAQADVVETNAPAFDVPQAIDAWFARPQVKIGQAHVIWIVIDPSSGGTQHTSEFSVVAGVMSRNDHFYVSFIRFLHTRTPKSWRTRSPGSCCTSAHRDWPFSDTCRVPFHRYTNTSMRPDT